MRGSLRRDKEEREREVVQRRERGGERRLAKREIVICLHVNGLNIHNCE